MNVATVFRSVFFLLASFVGACASVAPSQSQQPIALDGKATALRGKRYLEVRVGVRVEAPPEVVWALLTDARAFPEWNSTVTSLEGTLAEGERIELVSTVDPKRTFRLTVSELRPQQRMVWEDGGRAFRGVRTFTLRAREDGTTEVTMAEVFTGSMMEMIEPKLPDFRPSFDAFAADLKREAERRAVAGAELVASADR